MEERMVYENSENAYYSSPVGTYQIKADDEGVLSIKLISEETEKSDNTSEKTENQHLQECMEWLDVYFNDLKSLPKTKRPALNKKRWKHKGFCCGVWKALEEKLPPGKLLSYGEVANLVGNPKAARAVGMAMKTNPFSIIMPCHRVVNKYKLGNYSSLNGVKTKMWLLQHENADLKNLK